MMGPGRAGDPMTVPGCGDGAIVKVTMAIMVGDVGGERAIR